MATYKVSELYERVHELKLEGYEYVDVDIIPADDELVESITFSAIEECDDYSGYSIDFDPVESHEPPKNYTCFHL